MATVSYVAGTEVVCTASITVAGVATDPTEIGFAWQVGFATPTDYPSGDTHIIHDSTGTYHVNIDTTGLSGTVRWWWVATGTAPCAAAGSFNVAALPGPSPL